jgi:spermidine synthase
MSYFQKFLLQKSVFWLFTIVLCCSGCSSDSENSLKGQNRKNIPLTTPLSKVVFHNPEKKIKVVKYSNRIVLTVKGVVQAQKRLGGVAPLTDPMVDLVPRKYGKGHVGLVIGLGGGKTASDLAARGIEVDAVELESDIASVAKKYFGYKGKVIVGDGITYLRENLKVYDIILLDAFAGDKTPSHFLTLENLKLIQRHLSEQGVLLFRTIVDPDSKEFITLNKRFRTVFYEVIPFSSSFARGEQTVYLSTANYQDLNAIPTTFPLRRIGMIDLYVAMGKNKRKSSKILKYPSITGYLVKIDEGKLLLQLPHYEMGNHLVFLKGKKSHALRKRFITI